MFFCACTHAHVCAGLCVSACMCVTGIKINDVPSSRDVINCHRVVKVNGKRTELRSIGWRARFCSVRRRDCLQQCCSLLLSHCLQLELRRDEDTVTHWRHLAPPKIRLGGGLGLGSPNLGDI